MHVLETEDVDDVLGGEAEKKATHDEGAYAPVKGTRQVGALGDQMEEDEPEEDAGGKSVDD